MKATLKIKLLMSIILLMASSFALGEPDAESATAAPSESTSEDIGTTTEAEENSTTASTESSEEVVEKIVLNQDSVINALKARYKWIQSCHDNLSDEQKAKTPSSVTASFIIGKFGQVKRLSFKERLDPESGIQQCFTGKLLPKRFPSPENGKPVRIKFPVKFN